MKYSIIKYSGLEKTSMRLDSEYYHPHNLKLLKKLQSKPHLAISSFSFVTDGIHESIQFDNSSHINLISAKAPKENFFDLSGCSNISVTQDKNNPRTRLRKSDIIVSTVGTIGNCAVVDDSILPANSDRHVGIIRIKKDFYPRFISSFLLSKYGRFQTFRESTGNVQLNLFIYKIKEIIVPSLSSTFQLLIEKICLKAADLNISAINFYCQAEQTLLSDLDLLDWKPKHRLSFVKNFSDTVFAGRYDAEYFQPMYEEIVKTVKSSENCVNLDDIISIKKGIEPGREAYQDNGVMFVRVSNLSKSGFKDGNQQYVGDDLYRTKQKYQPKQREILLSKDGTPGIAYYLKDEPERMIPSGGILRLKVNDESKVSPEYLTLVLNSVIVQKQIERDVGGSIINHWLVDQVKKTLIPVLPVAKQKEIADTVNESFSNRELSKQLLEIAKRGVELAIEKDEHQAQKWIDEKLNRIGITISK